MLASRGQTGWSGLARITLARGNGQATSIPLNAGRTTTAPGTAYPARARGHMAGGGLLAVPGELCGAAGRADPPAAPSHPRDQRQAAAEGSCPALTAHHPHRDPPWPPSSRRCSWGSGSAAPSPLVGTARLWERGRSVPACPGESPPVPLPALPTQWGSAEAPTPQTLGLRAWQSRGWGCLLLPAPQAIQGDETPCPRANAASPLGEGAVHPAASGSSTYCPAPQVAGSGHGPAPAAPGPAQTWAVAGTLNLPLASPQQGLGGTLSFDS